MSTAALSGPGVVYRRNDPSRIVSRMTQEEYFAFERNVAEKHEFVGGEVIRMAGASPEHNLISANLLRTIGNSLEAVNADCDAYGSDQRIYISETMQFYPDISVVCSDAQFDHSDSLRNPLLIAEVLSPSTAAFDLGEKFAKYRTLAALRHYLLVEQTHVSVTHYEKISGNVWAIVGDYTSLLDMGTFLLGETQITLPLSAIYRRVEFTNGNDAKQS